MRIRSDLQLGGIWEYNKPTVPLEYKWPDGYTTLPSGVQYVDVASGVGTARPYAFNNGFLDLTSPAGSAGQLSFLRFDNWLLDNAAYFHQVIFTIDEISFPDVDGEPIRCTIGLGNQPTNTHGGNIRTGDEFGLGAFRWRNPTETSVAIRLNPAHLRRDAFHTIGWGWQIEPGSGQRWAIAVYGGSVGSEYVVCRERDDNLSLGSDLVPYVQLQTADGTEFTVRSRGARLRKWRFVDAP